MKRILALVLALVMATFAFTACNSGNGGTETNAPGTNAPETETPETNAPGTNAPETETPETEAPSQELDADVYKHVVLIGVDGAGAFFNKTDTPNLDKIFENGAITYTCQASTPSISAECWGSMLHGVTPNIHRLTNSVVGSRAYDPESEFPSFFRVIHEDDPEAPLASFSTWNPINIGIIEDNLGVKKLTAGNDAELTDKIVKYLNRTIPKMLFIQFDDCDGAGHGSGFGESEQLEQITITDRYIAQIYNKYVEEGVIEDTLFIVTADHGGYGHSHGGEHPNEMNVMFAAAGKTVVPGGNITSVNEDGNEDNMQMRDIAAVVLHAFGLDIPETWTGIVPNGLFEGYEIQGNRPEYSIEYEYAHRTKESTPTPEADSGNYITDVLASRDIIYYLPLDGDINDAFGGETEQDGKLYFVDGYYGQACKFDDGCITLWDYVPGTESFTISLWMKSSGIITSDPSIISNKNWESGKNPGFILSLRGNDVVFNAGNGVDRLDATELLPVDNMGGWVHLIAIVNREAGRVGISFDFNEPVYTDIPDSLKNTLFNASTINIGQDSTKEYASLPATLDEVLLISGAITEAEIDALAEYYGVEK